MGFSAVIPAIQSHTGLAYRIIELILGRSIGKLTNHT
jgi:hypothetical protein